MLKLKDTETFMPFLTLQNKTHELSLNVEDKLLFNAAYHPRRVMTSLYIYMCVCVCVCVCVYIYIYMYVCVCVCIYIYIYIYIYI